MTFSSMMSPKSPRIVPGAASAGFVGPMSERIEVQRTIAAPAADVFAVLCDPQGHVAIDATGMLQRADGQVATRDPGGPDDQTKELGGSG